jgi:hypothetical protein
MAGKLGTPGSWVGGLKSHLPGPHGVGKLAPKIVSSDTTSAHAGPVISTALHPFGSVGLPAVDYHGQVFVMSGRLLVARARPSGRAVGLLGRDAGVNRRGSVSIVSTVVPHASRRLMRRFVA